jgi:outer membrane receptor protein involved in Fe transport
MMKRFDRVSLALALVMLLLLPRAAAAQETGSGRITGVVKDAHGLAIPNAEIVVTGAQTGAEFQLFTDANGTWTVASLPADSYSVTATAPATVPGTLRDLKVAPGATATANLTLQVGISETVVVTASRVEQLQVDAAALVTIVNEQRLAAMPTQNYADVMRQIPGVNVVQMSARDFNVTPRGATNVPAASQLVMIDGRPINQDYYGYVAWDFMPTGFGEVKRIEVLSGAASAVWGAYAMNGVVNILTKSPREMAGTTVTMGVGTFDRSGGIAPSDSGSLYYVNATHAQAVNDRWSYKVSAGYSQSDAFARPSGNIPNSFQTPYPTFQNFGTKQPKVEGRADYDSADGIQHLSVSGGYSGTGGTFHTGLGPFHLEDGASGTYSKFDYRRNGWSVKSYVNLWHGEASSLLAVGPLGAPLLLKFEDRSWDVDVQRTQVLAKRHALTYGGNFKHNWTSITMAPLADKREQVGGYIQDEIFLSDNFRLEVGGRVDKYDSPKDALFSPRAALLVKPTAGQTFRVSYSRAYRAPSLFQNYLDTTVVNRLNLGLLSPALNGTNFFFPIHGVGNVNLEPQTLDAYEASYSASLAGGRAHATAAVYLTDSRNDMILTQIGSYSSTNVPAGWPLPPSVLNALIAGNVFGPGLGLPSVLGFQNLGEVRNKGFETSVDAQLQRYVSLFANYSWQAKPEPKDFPISKINLPPTNRANLGVNLDYQRFLGDISLQYTSEAFFRDVLDATYAGFTQPFTVINAGAGYRIPGDKATVVVKVRNLANEAVQNHLFGDLLKRQVVAELRLRP